MTEQEQIDEEVQDQETKEAVEFEKEATSDASFEESANAKMDLVIESMKELTKHISELTKVQNGMKESHDKWVRAGKF